MTSNWYKDTAERVAWTFVQGAAAEVILSGTVNSNTWQLAAVAGALSVAKCLVALKIGSPNTAATLPADEDTPHG